MQPVIELENLLVNFGKAEAVRDSQPQSRVTLSQQRHDVLARPLGCNVHVGAGAPGRWLQPLTGPVLAALIGGFCLPAALVFKETMTAAFVGFMCAMLPLALVGLAEPASGMPGGLMGFTVLLPVASLVLLCAALRWPRRALLAQIPEPASLGFSPGVARPCARRC